MHVLRELIFGYFKEAFFFEKIPGNCFSRKVNSPNKINNVKQGFQCIGACVCNGILVFTIADSGECGNSESIPAFQTFYRYGIYVLHYQ